MYLLLNVRFSVLILNLGVRNKGTFNTNKPFRYSNPIVKGKSHRNDQKQGKNL